MRDYIEEFLSGETGSLPQARVAYTLNNTQPVKSSYIGAQPFFFFEDSITEEDELAIEAELMDLLNQSIRDVEKDLFECERLASIDMATAQERIEEFQSDMDAALYGAGDEKQDIAGVMAQSRFAKSLYDFALENNVAIETSPYVDSATYDKDAQAILINDVLSAELQFLFCVRELRRVWQHKQGAAINPLTFQPDHAVLVNRAQIADLYTAMIRAAWEASLPGDQGVWDAPWALLENSDNADLAMAFAREASSNFRALDSGLAAGAVFETWFLSQRCYTEDKKLIQLMLADHNGIVFDVDSVSHNATVSLIEALGRVPGGKNYLAPHIGVILDDPLFSEVRDRSNANFLWFIKFEQSFREAEQFLHPDDEDHGHASSSGQSPRHGSTQHQKGQNYENATVLQFPRFGNQSTNHGQSVSDQNRPFATAEDSQNVVSLFEKA